MSERELTHIDARGDARMVDISEKRASLRSAVARGAVRVERETLELIEGGDVPKGDVFTVARVAGIMAAKRTSESIPMCHPVPVSGIDVRIWSDFEASVVQIEATVKTQAATGVEMEALSAVTGAALTVYDMCKSAEKGMVIENVRLVQKSGGSRGDYIRPGEEI